MTWAVGFLAAVAIAAAATPSARAHAQLVSTSPASGAVLERAPERVVVRFDEPVSVVSGSLRVFDGEAERVDGGSVDQPSATELEVELRGDLPDDVYTVAWRAISSDSHPIRGAFVFTVGAPTGDSDGVIDEVLGDEGSAAVDTALAITRFAGLALILLCIGGAASLVFVADTARRRSRVVWTALGLAAALLVIDSLAWVGLTGAQAVGLGLDALFRTDLFSDTARTSFGLVWLARAGLATALAVVALGSANRRTERAVPLAAALAGAIGVTPALSGHARAEGVFAMVSDAVHTLAAGAWVGGVAFLALMLVAAGGDRWSFASFAVPRFSAMALVAVGALVAAGVASALVQLGSVSDLRDTTYGRLLVAKVALLMPLLALGAFNNRRSVPRLEAGAPSSSVRRRFSQAISVELALMVLVIGVTTALVAEPPAKAATGAQVVTRDGEVGPFAYSLTVEPAVAGRNEVHVYVLDSGGQPAAVDEITLEATLSDLSVGPLALDTLPAGPGHVVASGELPLRGTWLMRVDVRQGEFDEWSTEVPIDIGKDSP